MGKIRKKLIKTNIHEAADEGKDRKNCCGTLGMFPATVSPPRKKRTCREFNSPAKPKAQGTPITWKHLLSVKKISEEEIKQVEIKAE